MKKIKALAGCLALAAILGTNGYLAATSSASPSELTIDGLESLADPEPNPWYYWIPYGYEADEYFVDYYCTYITHLTIKGHRVELPVDGHKRECYDGGDMNCDSFDCKRGLNESW